MHYVAAYAVDESTARERVRREVGYTAKSIGELVMTSSAVSNSRQRSFIFETDQDVTQHPLFTPATLAERHADVGSDLDDGPLLELGPEVTAGG